MVGLGGVDEIMALKLFELQSSSADVAIFTCRGHAETVAVLCTFLEKVIEVPSAQSGNRFTERERCLSAVQAHGSFTDSEVIPTVSFMVEEGLKSPLK